MKKKQTKLLLFLVLALIVVLWIFRSSWHFRLVPLDRVIEWVELARTNIWLSLAFYVVFILGVAFLPITLFPIVGGVLFPFWIALPLNLFAATIGSWISFAISRHFGRRMVEPILKKKFKGWEKVADTQGFKAIVLLRLIGVPPFLVANYALGFSGVNHQDLLLGTVTGILPWMCVVTFFSHSLWNAILIGGQKGLSQALFQAMAPLMMVSAMVLLVVAAGYFIKRRRHSNL